MTSLFDSAAACLAERDITQKLAATARLAAAWQNSELTLSPCSLPIDVGRPEKPELVDARQLQQRGFGLAVGRAAMIHAIAHIEFNAINLSLDAVCRFTAMPRAYYDDWVRVAAEEAFHFSLLSSHLQHLGYQYGDFPAHNGLWEMVQETSYDVLARMALVPRVLEARGLDVTPGLMQKFAEFGNTRMSEILAIILRDEIGHVAIGNRWFNYLCTARQLDPFPTFITLLKQHFIGEIKGPFSIPNREKAGFSAKELAWFCEL